MNRFVAASRSVGFHRGRGRLLARRRSRAFASATDRIPSPTSVRTSRGSALPRLLPVVSSSTRAAGVYLWRCTTSARPDLTWSRSRQRLAKSRTARGSGARGHRPDSGTGRRSVRSTSTNPCPVLRRSDGTSMCTGPLGAGTRCMPCSCSASRPVITASGPQWSRPAERRSSRVGAPLFSSTTPGSSDRQGPPGRHRCAIVDRCRPSSCRSRTRTTVEWHSAAYCSGLGEWDRRGTR